MSKTKDNKEAREKCYCDGIRCSHMTGKTLDTCEIVGVITPNTRHACYLSGYADWEVKKATFGKVPHAPPCR